MDSDATPPHWRVAFEKLLLEGAEAPARNRDGSWTVSFDFGMVSVGTILAHLPGNFERVHEAWENMIDHSGEEVDVEVEEGVFACDAERALLEYTEHWQAGVSASVTVYPNDETYRAARSSAVAERQCDS